MKLVFTKAIAKDVRKLKDPKLISRVELALQQLKDSNSLDDIPNVKRLKGHPYAYRIRIGQYRLGFYVNENTLVLARFLKRNDIYKVFPPD